jgi:hypothetical protein
MMDTQGWEFDVDTNNVYAVYLCWRAVGSDRWDSLYNALRRVRPCEWAFTMDDEENHW